MGAFLLLYSWSAEEGFVVLSWPNVGNVLFVFASLRHSGLLTVGSTPLPRTGELRVSAAAPKLPISRAVVDCASIRGRKRR